MLFRSTGKLKKEKIIAAYLSERKAFIGFTSRFIVRKDQYSDNYAVANFDFMERDKAKRIEIIHFGTDHNEISRKFCITPEEEKARSEFIDLIVMGSEKVSIFLSIPRPGNNLINVMATLEKGAGSFEFTELKILGHSFIQWGLAKYNPISKKIFFLAIVSSEKNGVYLNSLYAIDPILKSTETISDLSFNEKLHEAYNNTFDSKKGYRGMPQDLIINDDGSFTLLYEEIMFIAKDNGNGTQLGQIAVSNYDKNGTLNSNYFVLKSNWVYNTQLNPLYISKRDATAQELFKGNQYKSFVYISGIKNKYILFNDTERNNDITDEKLMRNEGGLERGKIVMVQGITGGCDAFMYKLTGNDVIPKREYAFGKKEHGNTLSVFTIANYDKKTNTYVTLKLDKESMKDKMVKLVWEEVE